MAAELFISVVEGVVRKRRAGVECQAGGLSFCAFDGLRCYSPDPKHDFGPTPHSAVLRRGLRASRGQLVVSPRGEIQHGAVFQAVSDSARVHSSMI